MKRIRKRLTYANVVSSLALFLVLTGATAFAATQLEKNSVGSKQLKKNAVTTAKIKKEAITNGKIKKGSITGASLNLGSIGTVPNATTSETAKSANTAATAEGPAAWVHVSGNGVFLAGRGIAAADVSLGDTDYYCIKGVPFDPAGAVATVDYWNATQTFSNIAQVGLASSGGLSGSGCPAGTQLFVKGWNANTGAASKTGFYLTVFK